MLFRPQRHPILISDEIVARPLIDEFELVDTLFGGGDEFGGVGGGALEVGQAADHPGVEHHELDGEVV